MKVVRPILKRLHSPDIHNLETYEPEDKHSFVFLLQAMFGPKGVEGEESFDFIVCTPSWLAEQVQEAAVISGRNLIIVREYDMEAIRRFLMDHSQKCAAGTWNDVALRLSRIGKWEFEDYEV